MPTEKLIEWYQDNKRELPWRNTRDPYKIWLSEIILQQTRVAQGLSYYRSFIRDYPTVDKLAQASEEEVLKLWQGLGYYSRARNLHKTAKHVYENLDSKFPSSSESLQSLKGVGPYTAAAIASFCFQEAVPVLDGNVYRFLSRFYGSVIPINTPEGYRYYKELAEAIIPKQGPDIFNQAIMEFGAMLCKPKAPLCNECPLNFRCVAFEKGLQNELPKKVGKTRILELNFTYFILKHGNEVLVKKRSKKGIWQGLYEFYLVESDWQANVNSEAEIQNLRSELKLKISEVSIGPEYNHILSHRKIRARFIELSLKSKPEIKDQDMHWVAITDIRKLPVSRLMEKYLEDHLAPE